MSAYKIKVKNKYLIIAVALVLSTAGLVRAAGDTYLFKMAEAARQDNDPVKAFAYYDRLISEYPNSESVPAALYWSASHLPDSHSFRAVIFPSSRSITHSDSVLAEMPKGVLSKQERLRRVFTDYPDHWGAPHALSQFAEGLYRSGDPRAEEFLLKAVHDGRSGDQVNAAFLLVDMYIAQGRSGDALNMLEYCAREASTSYAEQRQMKKGDVLAAIGDYEAAREAYEETLNVFERTVSCWHENAAERGGTSRSPVDIESTRQYYRDQVDAKLADLRTLSDAGDAARGTGIVEGTVLLAGRPLQGARILVYEVEEEARFSTDYHDMPWQAVGDDGGFRFELPSGRRYEVGIAVSDEVARKVEGQHLQMVGAGFVLEPGETKKVELRFVEPVKVEEPAQGFTYDGKPFPVKWQTYPGARTYRVTLGYITMDDHSYSSMSGNPMRTADTHLHMDSIPAIPFGMYGGDEKGILPAFLIGRADAYSLQIEAIDEHGSIISSSSGLYFGASPNPATLIKAKPVAPTQAEKLLIDRKYDEAVAALGDLIEKNPDDIRALEILSRVYFMGTHYPATNGLGRDLAHRDPERSRDMLKRLAALEPNSEHLSALAAVCMSLGDRASATEAYRMMVEEGTASSAALNVLAYHALTESDDYQQALAYLEQAALHAENAWEAVTPCGLYVLMGQFDKAVELLDTVRAEGVGTFAGSGLNLPEALRDYAAWSSRRPSSQRNDCLGAANQSFLKAEQAWRDDGGAHSSFLLLITELSDPWRHQHRDELQNAIDQFLATHGKEAPILLNVVEAFVQVGGL